MESTTADRLAALAHPQRLALFRLLMRRHPDRLPAGEIAVALGVAASTLSAWLAALLRAGLVTQTRAGTSLRYGIDADAVRLTFEHLLLDCCRGRPEICAPALAAARTMGASGTGGRHRVLFLCTGNSARSLMAEAVLRDMAGDRFEACSAGTRPRGAPDPRALAVLVGQGHDVSALRTKPIAAFRQTGAPVFDVVLTLCDRAANEECPAWPGMPVAAHWGMPAPSRRGAGPAAFADSYALLRERIGALAALPLGTLDRIGLQAAIDEMSRIGAGAHA